MFFRVTKGKLELDLEYVLFYDDFRKIYESDPTPNKDTATRIFKYIYEIADYKSHSNRSQLSKEKARHHAINLSGLDSDFVPDNNVQKAIKTYRKLNHSIIAELLKDLTATLLLSTKLNSKIYKAIELELKNEDMPKESIGTVITLQTKLFDLIDGLPSRVNRLKALELEVYEELAKSKDEIRGGGEILDSYEGDPQIEGI